MSILPSGLSCWILSRLTKTLSKVSDKIRSMENNLNEFTEEHDQDHSGIIKKKWEEHINAPAASPTPYPLQDDLSRDTSNRRAEKDMNTIDNYIHLDNEILETSKNDITKTSPVDDNDEAHSSLGNYIRLDNEMGPKLSEILEILKDDISESSANASWTLGDYSSVDIIVPKLYSRNFYR